MNANQWPGHTTDSGIHVRVADSQELRVKGQDVRWDVFVIEQSCPLVLEIDARDQRDDVTHLVAIDQSTSQVVGTCRIIPDGAHHYHLGRIAVRREYRSRKVGAALVQSMHEVVAQLTPTGQDAHVVLDAQVQASGFYAKQGYVETTGEIFQDAGIDHVEMGRIVHGCGH
ncbi:GNAT family N-acetyltransferase [Schaalia vaccimaxillae]|uniref:GNAT family N-acetyltransferase n=1 Tax=Schaalia vaccimaxillae TaxID=183916 RepID=UPI0003B45204|nr:GNAT family N-acetyltransferase [Schaalia vaccimaxillae]